MTKMAALPNTQDNGLSYDSLIDFGSQTSAVEKGDKIIMDDVPPGFPSRFTGDRVWSGLDMVGRQDEWIIQLSKQDHDNIVEALRHFQSKKES